MPLDVTAYNTDGGARDFDQVHGREAGLVPILRFDHDLAHTPAFFHPLADQARQGIVTTALLLGVFGQLLAYGLDLATVVVHVDFLQVVLQKDGQIFHARHGIVLIKLNVVPVAGCHHDVPAITADVDLVEAHAVADQFAAQRIEVMHTAAG